MKHLFLLTALLGALTAPAATTSVRQLIGEYEADSGSVGGFYNVPWSAVCFEQREKLNSGWLARLEKVDYAALEAADKIDYALLRLTCQS